MRGLLGETFLNQTGAASWSPERKTEEAVRALKTFRKGLDHEDDAAKTLLKAVQSGSSLRISDALADFKRARDGVAASAFVTAVMYAEGLLDPPA